MTEVPEHLRKRAEEARTRAAQMSQRPGTDADVAASFVTLQSEPAVMEIVRGLVDLGEGFIVPRGGQVVSVMPDEDGLFHVYILRRAP